jgi:hypothetical protein
MNKELPLLCWAYMQRDVHLCWAYALLCICWPLASFNLILNHFLFIRELSCPNCIQASLSLNCLKLTTTRFPYNCLPVSCGGIGFKKILAIVLVWKSGLKVPLLHLGPSCLLQTILLSDLVRCDSPLQIVMAIWRTIIVSRGLSHQTQKVQIQTKRAPNCHYYLQRAVTPEWKGSIALWWHIRAFFARVEKPSDVINSCLFLMNKKGLSKHKHMELKYVLRVSIRNFQHMLSISFRN